jgi:acetyl-CoA acetyltransferase
MLEEIHLAGSVRTPFGSFCGAFADVSAAELGKAAAEPSGVKPEDVKELLSIC